MSLPARNRAAMCAAALMTGLGLLLPHSVAQASPSTDGSSPVASTRPGQEREPLTPAQVREQVAEAERMQKKLEATDAKLAAANAKLAALAARSNLLMDEVTAARSAQKVAERNEARQKAKLKKLAAETAAARRDLERMAYDAYVNGPGSLREVAALVDLVSGGEEGVAVGTTDYLSGERAADESRYAALTKAQQQVAQQAAKASAEREAATAKAVRAQQASAAAVAAQQKALIEMQQVAGNTRAALADLGVDAQGRFAGIDMATLSEVSTTPLCTQQNGVYANGMIPGSALCPISGAPGHMMRPEAARALSALREAYAQAFGQQMCMTDSYRSYAAQVDVKRRKPRLAATPGTSNHGLGLAVDLCGGIENFGTPQHEWMKQHAPLFGYFHPSWAQAGGSKPEPWHWEFAS
ncbi:M15 family metallopeptidase [Gephyromycinifex aptenodytis]|uniref:M15 family metallopeptidase n=1 Tax=Gephyromycinifex aptenodytis TaxID=2716227 RepID=UPI0014461EFB|nr:M15 family metallopeptidase [Gephyromycinifex aptenodytis]